MKKLHPAPVHIRWMVRRDLPYVTSFDTGWSEEDFTKALSIRNQIGLVAEKDDEIQGVIVYQLNKKDVTVLGIGFKNAAVMLALIDKMKSKLSTHRRTKLIWYVSERADTDLLYLVAQQGFYSRYKAEVEAIKFVYKLPSEALSVK